MNDLFLAPEHVLQGGYFHETLRKLQEPNTSIEPHNVMYPVFLLENEDGFQAVSSMPNVYRYGVNKLIPALTELVKKGLKSILIFGIVETLEKDAVGSNADSPQNPVIKALPKLREALPQLVLAADVCLCPYTSHGHCGLLTANGSIDHSESVKRIAEVALAYAKAGAHIVAPSDMMDNRIKAIKDSLVANKLQNQVSVLSYSCKFASSMYGPFRDTMKSSPMAGDRKCYQLPPGSAGLAARAAARDVAEGADFLMVKPGLPYLDIVRQTKDKYPLHPLFIYQAAVGSNADSPQNPVIKALPKLREALPQQVLAPDVCLCPYTSHGHCGLLTANGSIDHSESVKRIAEVSGEYAMICRSGDSNEVETILMETLACMRRAGADCIITYFAPLILDIISRKQ